MKAGTLICPSIGPSRVTASRAADGAAACNLLTDFNFFRDQKTGVTSQFAGAFAHRLAQVAVVQLLAPGPIGGRA